MIDILIIVLYLGGVIASGFWFSKRQSTTTRYFLAGRNLPWWAAGASIVATETSTITFISVPGIAYAYGGNFTFLQLVFGYVIGRVVIVLLFIPSYFEKELVTVYELLQKSFGAGVRALASSLFIVMRTIADGIRLLLTSIVIGALYLAFVPGGSVSGVIVTSLLVLGVILIVFTFLGGIEAVVWVEVVQLAIYLVGALGAAIVLAGKIPGGVHAAIDLGAQFGKFRLLDFALDATHSYVFWGGLIGGCFLTMSTHGTDQLMVQRYLSTKNRRHAAAGLLMSAVVVFLQFAGFLFIGVLLFAYYRPDLAQGWGAAHPALPFAAPDQVFPDFIANQLPTGLMGLVVAAILAAAMSSSSLNAIAAAATTDLYRPMFPDRSDEHYLRVSHVMTVLAGIVQVGIGISLVATTRSALDLALAVASLLNGPILGLFLLGATKRADRASGLFGMTVGLAVVTWVWLGTPVAWPWYAAIGSLTTLVSGLAWQGVTKPVKA